MNVHDLADADRKHLEAFLATAIGSLPLGRADDLVAELRELGLNHDPLPAALCDLGLQDLTGLLGTMSSRRALPPEVAVRDAAPLILVCDQRRERIGVTLVERFGGRAKTVDHRREYAIRIEIARGRACGF